ncbi:DUF4157 domain-containing protein [Aestuariibius sp. 2305UL40-4]|uniref:eCIS core domain-containing protein n=1 Tax=Aestuariibius violaceus TaxID=3234132 RepID=UPI00345E2A22
MPRRAALLALCLATPLLGEPADTRPVARPSPQIDVSSYFASALTAALTQARDTYAAEADPIPSNIRGKLTLYYTAADLDPVRFIVDRSPATLPALINGAQLDAGGTANHAVVAGHVIVFGNPPGDETTLYLWAHEVCHTIQYRRLGMDGFAAAYLADAEGMEAAAHAAGLAAVRRARNPSAPVEPHTC